jgi:hypothetical protein
MLGWRGLFNPGHQDPEWLTCWAIFFQGLETDILLIKMALPWMPNQAIRFKTIFINFP